MGALRKSSRSLSHLLMSSCIESAAKITAIAPFKVIQGHRFWYHAGGAG